MIGWTDLTVPDAEGVRDFYAKVVGWRVEPVEMSGYSDFTMVSPGTGQGVAGVCHARGSNEGLPAQWLIYVIVEDIEASMRHCRELGGEVIAGPKSMGAASYCVIRDPAGAVCALYQPE
jgi:predicted enzyme related to lactoylglutathione lyase